MPVRSLSESDRGVGGAAERIRKFIKIIKIRPPVLCQVHVRVLPAGLATKDSDGAVKYYWERFFRELGVTTVTCN